MATETVYLQACEPDYDTVTTCPVCGFDAVVKVPIVMLSDLGVSAPAASMGVCSRCADEEESS